jgi:hypothetical protein
MFELAKEIDDTFELLKYLEIDQVILHDEFDILTISKNIYGTFILSSIIEEDYDNKCLFYFLVLMTNLEYSNFINHRISYFELIKSKESIFIAQKDYFYNINKLYKIDVLDIPQEYLPDSLSYYPNKNKANTFQLDLVFEGKNADKHELPLNTMNKTNNIIGKIDSKIREILNLSEYELNVGLNAASFDISYFYKVIHNNTYQLFDSGNDLPINILFTKLINLIINKVYNFKLHDIFKSDEFIELQNHFYSLVLMSKKNLSEEKFQIKFKQMIIDTMKDFVDVSDLTGKGFSSLSISIEKLEDSDDKKEKLKNIIQVIDPSVSKNLQLNENNLIEYLDKETSSTKDSNPQLYSILIFELNTETKKGRAYLEIKDSKKKPKIAFSVSGVSSIIDTKITHSLAEEEIIDINGIATYDQNKKITFINITL